MRKLATQVPASVSRLLQSSLLQSPPAWYTPVLANPPPVLPPRQTVPRQRKLPGGMSDLPPQHLDRSKEGLTRTHKMKHLRETKPRPQEIVYPEDRVRRQFFKDFPFEALRPTSLVEGQDLRPEGATGREWISLAQRGAYPTVESTIAFALNLHNVHGRTISDAYAIATEEFVQLRSAHEMSTLAAELEARAHGADLKADSFERAFALEGRALDTLGSSSTTTVSTSPSTKYRKPSRWSSTVSPSALSAPGFTGGESYVQKWRLPPPLQVSGEAEGDLVSAITSEAGAIRGAEQVEERQERRVEEMDDLELLDAAIGQSHSGGSR